MVRLDKRFRPGLALGIMLLAAPAFGQDGPLTTLMRPAPLSRQNQLFGDNPLTNTDRLSGEDSLSGQQNSRGRAAADPAKPGDEAAACDPARRRPTVPSLASGGSGPGEYGRFVDTGRTESAKPPASAPRPSSAAPSDRPLYGGTDRPLWNEGAPSAARQGPPRPGASARADRDAPTNGTRGDDATAESRVAPAAGVDRPLWAEPGDTYAAPADPCATDASTRRAGVATQPTQSLFFGTIPAR
jgi:hypothetical protein